MSAHVRLRDAVSARRALRRTQVTDAPARSLLTNPSGFTVIEMVIVISLIVLLAGMTLVNHRNGVTRAKEAVLKQDLFQMRDAIDQYYADKTKYPESLDALVSDGYLRRLPEDPFTRSATTWITIPSEADPNNPTAPPGVYDVKSGSDAKALDGTSYADW